MADDIKQQHGVSMIAIPWEFADWIVYEGYEKAKARGQSGLEDFHAIRSVIGTGKPKAVTHPVYEKLGTGGLSRRSRGASSRAGCSKSRSCAIGSSSTSGCRTA